MLGYVFWHWPGPAVAREEYERQLELFHRSLDSDRPHGHLGSAAFRTKVPWLPGLAYEDWYLVESFEALGVLNDAAIAGPHRAQHDPVAANAADGAGAIYRLHQCDPGLSTKRHVAWLTKPRGTSYS